MIGTIDIEVNAKFPNMPLEPMFAYVGSASSIRIRNVPRKIGEWRITDVFLSAQYPDGSIKSATCVLCGGVWVGTVEGCYTSGKSEKGYTILANGITENGIPITGYVLGKGDINILESDGTITPGQDERYVHLLDEQSATPQEGDLYPTSDGYKIWQNGQANSLGTELSPIQISAIDSVVDERKTVVTYTDGTTAELDIEGTLESMSIPNIDNVAAVKIGTAVTSIGDSAFEYCSSLTSATIPDSVTSIGERAFYYCDALMSLTIGNGVTTIGESAFNTCNSLTSATMPDSVTSIGSSAFTDCYNLTSVMIGNGVTSIGANVFVWCSSLANVTFKGRTLADVHALANYPWGADASVFSTWNEASKEWVEETKQEKLSNAQITAINSVVAGDYVKAAVMTESEYAQITPDSDTVYFVTEDPNA